ncbi:GntR family transcriptional regulator [Tetragenococcus halophilus]|uniref:GntR family transcriptional regulator n=1 Tax=Tetragenococcus halophilus TaxID=51669 RepID=A0A3G5FIF9_TETHA|nr:GntR family transcriptional regulator [Tetragenococcus halophilus]AYW50136.1 GntR family transcriptional regulator [Tetragenococcus halophilus]GBD65023.1 hypothetical protein TEHD23766T_2450 [Tetragenococcus halophilus subsp. flandriensis]
MPKYIEIANILRERIFNKTYPTSSLLPNQNELTKEFSVSRMTLRKALNILTMEGLIYSRRGDGTKVLNHPFFNKDTSTLTKYEGLSTEMQESNRTLTSQSIEFQVEFPDENLRHYLMLNAEEPVYKIIRLRLLEGQPFVLEHTYMSVNKVPGLKREHIEGSIYDYLKKELNIKFGGAYRNISADKSSFYDQKYLSCTETDPVLEIEQIVYQENGIPVEYSRSRNRFDVRSYTYHDIK